MIIEYRDNIVQARSLVRYVVLADDTTPGVSASPTRRAVPSKESPKQSPKQSPKRETNNYFSPVDNWSSPNRTDTKFGRSGVRGWKDGSRKSTGQGTRAVRYNSYHF